ncbi:MAG: peptidoglycan DD-metalloendopeptidase family protein [Candidatus Aminicenantes bacterium]|nr:peptidoglycan DD-metalloendopeptidase family protein [Candidatus Aminicenantes bacterium]
MRFLRTALLLAAAAAAAGPVCGQDTSGFDQRLAQIRRQIQEVRDRIATEESRKLTTLSSLERVILQKSLIRKELSLFTVRMAKTSQELAVLRRTIPSLRARLEREKASMEKTLVTLYKHGRLSTLQLFFRTEDITALVSESKNLSVLAGYQEEILGRYKATLDELTAAEKDLEAKSSSLEKLIGEARSKRRELEEQEVRHKRLIGRIQKNKSAYEETIRELEDRARQLKQLMEKLLRQEVVLPVPFIPLYERKGRLPWPVEGRVVSRFGLERHPQFRTATRNNGIDIAPAGEDAVVKAVHGGRVVFAGAFQGYGNLLILDHGLNYYSLYGHCSEFLASNGDLVEAEQPVGVAGDIGSLLGVTLYLEIRHKTKPQDPLKWLLAR